MSLPRWGVIKLIRPLFIIIMPLLIPRSIFFLLWITWMYLLLAYEELRCMDTIIAMHVSINQENTFEGIILLSSSSFLKLCKRKRWHLIVQFHQDLVKSVLLLKSYIRVFSRKVIVLFLHFNLCTTPSHTLFNL